MREHAASRAGEERDRVESDYWRDALAQATARAGKEERDDTVLRRGDRGEAREWDERQYAYSEECRMRAIAANLRSVRAPARRGGGPVGAPRRVTAAVRRRGRAA